MNIENKDKNLGDDEMGVRQLSVLTGTSGPLSSPRSEGFQDSGSEVGVSGESGEEDGVPSSEVIDWGSGERGLGPGETPDDRLETNDPSDPKLIAWVERLERHEAARLLSLSGMDYTEVARLLGISRNIARTISNKVDRELGLLSMEKMKEVLAIHFYQLFTNRALYQQVYLKALHKSQKADDEDRSLKVIDLMQKADKNFAWITNQVGVAALYKATRPKGELEKATANDVLKGLKRTKRRLLRPRHLRPMDGDTLKDLEDNGEKSE